MCGIAGVFSYKENIEAQRPFIDWSLCTMHHRGPDADGVWSNGKNYMAGFVRLSIRDLSAHGNQPMLSSCGGHAISFNGEIYNTALFRQKLERLGASFQSSTDTEVVLYGLIHWGVDYVLEQFDGMFAFAYFNENKNELVLARDRSGIKPLYIGHSAEGVVYSSQYDHIMAHPYISNNTINSNALGMYLQLGYVPEDAGAINGTFLLPHGYYVSVTEKGVTKHRYFKYPLEQAGAIKSFEQVIADSVQAQLVSDVPVGTFMSGGVDSPLVSYYANKHTPLQSFTIGVDDAAMDESKAAEEYANIFGTDHKCRTITEADLLATIRDNTKAYTEPFADFSSIPTLVLSKFARQYVTVALSGDGGDELFWGYPRNLRMLTEGMAFKYNKPQRLLSFAKEKLTGGKRTVRKRHLQVNDFAEYYYRSLFIYGAEAGVSKLFLHQPDNAFFLDQFYKEDNDYAVTEDNIMNIVRQLEFNLHLQRILIKVDRASMYHSLEVRVPLLSNGVIDYSSSLSHRQCIKDGQGKYNLKELLAQKSSERLVYQPKKGFVIPIDKWLRSELRHDLEDKLMNMPHELAVHFNHSHLQSLLNQHIHQQQNHGWMLWAIYSLVNWHTEHRNAKITATHLHRHEPVSGAY